LEVATASPGYSTRVDEIAIKTAKTGKVTAVVAVMSIFSKKRCNLRNAKSGNDKPSPQKVESYSRRPRNLSQKTKKGWLPKKLVSKSKKVELNSTKLMLKSKKTSSDCAKKPDPSISSGLNVENNRCLSFLAVCKIAPE
jgi:hypothetical protein